MKSDAVIVAIAAAVAYLLWRRYRGGAGRTGLSLDLSAFPEFSTGVSPLALENWYGGAVDPDGTKGHIGVIFPNIDPNVMY